MRKVIFPSAKIVAVDMQNMGKLPAIIYPVDQRAMIEFFMEYYFDNDRADVFEIVTYEAHQKVIGFLPRSEKIRVSKLDELRDLGYTVYWGLRQADLHEGDTIIINFPDVMLLEPEGELSKDCCYYADESPSSKWSYFEDADGVFTEIYDHSPSEAIRSRKMFIGVFGITKPLLLMQMLADSLQAEGECGVDSFYEALKNYSKRCPMRMVKTEDWFDIGHIERYYDAQLAIKSRTFNHIAIDKNRGILTKTSEDKAKLINEIKWYLKLPADIEYLRPRIFSYSLDYENPYVRMEYYAYHTLHELFLYGDLEEKHWYSIFRRIKFILQDMGRYTVSDENVGVSLLEVYMSKTISRMEKVMVKGLGELDFSKPLIVNGVCYRSWREIMEILPNVINRRLMACSEFSIIHGDLCFTNVLVDQNYSFVKCVDPRGSFGKFDIYGDRRYEYAKLMHSVEGKYDYIIRDLFTIETRGNRIDYRFQDRQKDADVLKVFLDVFNDEISGNMDEIKLLEAMLFLSMIPLHEESLKHQLLMMSTGLRLLGEVEDIVC
ncbi:hypothetical protein [Selenomonas sp. KH1T6]|uniref:hypothetical protein n=1 Tax=Selenomonas sp. KH1T6 TaxID=3158784 RepID=UPI0008A7A6DA|nr:hypothetical protein SAMN05216583_1144 [Selenomonas ruminantium]